VSLVQIQQKLYRPWQAVWHSLPASARHFLHPYYRKIFNNRLIVLLWPTFRCNYSCSYCPVHTKFDFATVYPRSSEKTWQQWVDAFEKLPPAVFYVAGGEPFLYAELPELLNNLPSKHNVFGIVSNLSLPARVIKKVKARIHLNASLHRECVSTEEFVAKVLDLQDSFHLEVNIVATPENLPAIEAIDKLLNSHDITLHVDPFVDTEFHYDSEQLKLLRKHTTIDRSNLIEFSDRSLKSCSAGMNYLNVMPNGDVFTCASGFAYVHSPLFAEVVGDQNTDHYRMGNLFDSDFALNKSNVSCTLPCEAYCDRDAALIKVVDS
jgi:MoaA/NifB/PqqE/SkfB family radical SAM enzyme